MRTRLVTGVLVLGLLLAGCAPSVAGQAGLGTAGTGGAASSTSGGRTLGVPSAGSTATRTSDSDPDTSASSSSSSSSRPTSTRPTGTSTSSAPVETSTDTTTQYTTVYTTPDAPPSSEPPVPGPLDVIGPVSMGPNGDGYLIFQSPSGNIFCGLFENSDYAEARCDIIDHSYADPPAQDCGETDFRGDVASVGPDGAGVAGVCAGDTLADPTSAVLGYGQNAGVGAFACHSGEEGVTCANLTTRHGFTLARASYQVF